MGFFLYNDVVNNSEENLLKSKFIPASWNAKIINSPIASGLNTLLSQNINDEIILYGVTVFNFLSVSTIS